MPRREAMDTRRALRHLKHRELTAGWNSWVEMVEEANVAEALRERARSAVLHLANRKLSVGWNAWVAFASERLEALQMHENPDIYAKV